MWRIPNRMNRKYTLSWKDVGSRGRRQVCRGAVGQEKDGGRWEFGGCRKKELQIT